MISTLISILTLLILLFVFLYKQYYESNIDLDGYVCTIVGINDIYKYEDDTENDDVINNMLNSSYIYDVVIKTNIGTIKKTLPSYNPNLLIGTQHKIVKNVNGWYMII